MGKVAEELQAKNNVKKGGEKKLREMELQSTSADIWDKKYRLKDKSGKPVDETTQDTLERIATALSGVEETDKLREHWYQRFVWALSNGALPAGRIISNAGAQAYKPATSTINCTVSGTISDSMNDILNKNHEAGMTLKAGCGIGYEFSTLRPKGAYVSGAGAYTSGPLSFMDIFDKMCFTVSSAGGRRGAQMATFDVSHPDVMEFIRAKREDGRLRQFNLSLLITTEFIEAVKNDADWHLSFPITEKEARTDKIDVYTDENILWRRFPVDEGYIKNEQGLTACKIFDTIPANNLWNMIMTSTYDFAEPGFILIDEVNNKNNNWFVENIRATNPCVTGDTRLATQYGMVQIKDLHESGAKLKVTVDKRALADSLNSTLTNKGSETRAAVPAFITDHNAEVFEVKTQSGYQIKATRWHDFYTQRGKIPLSELQEGDELLVQSGKGQFGEQGDANLGMLLGLIAGDGHFTNRGLNKQAAIVNFWGQDKVLAPMVAEYVNSLINTEAQTSRKYSVSPVAVPQRDHLFIRSVILARVLEHYGFSGKTKLQVPEVVWLGSEECVKSYLQALFQADGTVNVSGKRQSCNVRLASSRQSFLTEIQQLLANFGIYCAIHKRRNAGKRLLPDGKGGSKEYDCNADYELIIDGESRDRFMQDIGFMLDYKNDRYHEWAKDRALAKTQSFRTKISSIDYVGRETVYDTTQPDHNTVIFNGLVTGQCGEQPLPPYGSCLLGSVNLTKFVVNPFTEEAEFDWDKYREVVAVFTRMLDNVVEINGLPLEGQRGEIEYKRRHGMGFLGLGSTATMLGMTYGDEQSVEFTEKVAREMAMSGWNQALELAKEKGPAPIMQDDFEVTTEMLAMRPEMADDGYKVGDKVKGSVLHAKYSRYMQQIGEIDPALSDALAKTGARFTHHSSIAPTGTISLSMANNVSNGIEPSFAHHYSRNVIREGRKTKEKVDVFSYELLAYREVVNADAMPYSEEVGAQLPENFVTSDSITPKQHVDIQAAAQKWVDSSISKTANVPTEYPYEDFKDIYMYAYENGLKGCTTFRFNPEAFQGVLVKEDDLENTVYQFTLEDGSTVEFKGNEEVEYDGETHTAANLFDALKEGYYGKF